MMIVKNHGMIVDDTNIVKHKVESNCFLFTLALIVVECSSAD
jgi:hypothetical protein